MDNFEDRIYWDGPDLIVDNVRLHDAKVTSYSMEVPEGSGITIGPMTSIGGGMETTTWKGSTLP